MATHCRVRADHARHGPAIGWPLPALPAGPNGGPTLKGSADVVRAQGHALIAARPGPNLAIDAGQHSGRPKLLVRIRAAIQMRQYSPRTEEAYVQWTRRYIFFHKLRHPAEMGTEEIQAFLSHLAVRGNVSASRQNQALCALIFLYKVLGKEIGVLGDVVRDRRSAG